MQNSVRTIAPNHNQIRTEVVTTYEQLLHAYAIRSICFMEEHGVTARQDFDGNDYQATHMIVYAGDEPIGTLRIRWFKDFAKLERMAFREAYRNTHVLKAFRVFRIRSHRPQGIRQGHHPRAAKICAAVENHPRIQERRRQGAGLLRRSRGAVYRTRQGTHSSGQRNLGKHRRDRPVPDRGLLGCAIAVRGGRIVGLISAEEIFRSHEPRKTRAPPWTSPEPTEAGGRDPPGHVRKAAVRRGCGRRAWTWPNCSTTPARPTCKFRNGSTKRICLSIPFKIEHLPEAGIVDARRIVQPELVG